uniref:Ovule protein n=1 Tax=Gongylonema pulchrum TaxID=637853 RepID=A0A183DH35_9BILA
LTFSRVLEAKNVFFCCSENTTKDSRSARISCLISTTKEINEDSALLIHGLQIFFQHRGYHCLDEPVPFATQTVIAANEVGNVQNDETVVN